MSQPEKILVRSVNWLGDAVMTTPALQRLREARPEAHITLLTHAKLAGLWEQHPAIGKLKDIAAGAVLVVSAGALVCGLLIVFVPLLRIGR